MSGIEARLTRDIAAITGGVIVTESDLRTARDALEERLEIARRRGRRRTAVVVAVAVAAAVVVAILVADLGKLGDDHSAPPANPAPSASTSADINADFLAGDPPTAELLQGVWRVDNETVLLRFTAPDLVAIDSGGRLFHNPAVAGTYTIEGDLITVNVQGGQAACAGQSFAMRASVAEPGIVHIVHTRPGTGNCSETPDTWWTLEQVLPTANGLASLDLSGMTGWQPLADRVLNGIWMGEGGGHVLELGAGGTYYVADQSGDPVDRGRWSLRGKDLVLTSSAASVACNQGDRLVWTDLEGVDAGTRGMRGTAKQNTCAAGWASTTWILIGREGS